MQVMKATDIPDSYKLDNDVAMPGFNPDVTAYEDAPPGKHIMEIVEYGIIPDSEVKYKGTVFILDKLQIKQVVCAGQPHAGASVMDWIPMPSGPINDFYANKWANFITKHGFALPPGKIVPAGFHPKQLIGTKALVTIGQGADQSGQPKVKDNGEPQYEVKLFGYDHVGNAPTAATAAAPVTNTKQPPARFANSRQAAPAQQSAGQAAATSTNATVGAGAGASAAPNFDL